VHIGKYPAWPHPLGIFGSCLLGEKILKRGGERRGKCERKRRKDKR
jgi:hypothetical protein